MTRLTEQPFLSLNLCFFSYLRAGREWGAKKGLEMGPSLRAEKASL